MPFASSEGDARAYGIRQLGLFGRGGVDSRQSASESPPWMAAGHLGGGGKGVGGDMRKLVFADSKGGSEGGSYGKAFLGTPGSLEKSYSPAIRASALGQSPSVRHMRARHMRPIVFAEEHEERVFQSSRNNTDNGEEEEDDDDEEEEEDEERTPEKEPMTPGPSNSSHLKTPSSHLMKTPSRTPKQQKSASKNHGSLLHDPLTPGGVASPTAVHLFQQFFTASPGFYEKAERLKSGGSPLSPSGEGAPASPGGVGRAQRRPVLHNKSRLHDGAAASSAWGSPGPRTPGRKGSPGGFAGSPESPFVVRSQYGGSPGDAASPFVVRSQFPSPGGEESPFVFRSACKSGMGDSYYPGMQFTVDSSPFAEPDTELKSRRHFLAEEDGSGVAFEMEEMFENRFLEAARNAAGVGAASPASSSVCSLVIEYDSDEEQEERGELDPQLKEEMEERLANPVFTVAKPESGSRLDDAEGSPPRTNGAEGAQRRLFASPGRNQQPKTPRRVKVGASRFGIRRTLRDAQGAAATMGRGAWGELDDEEDENQEPRLETPKAPGGPLAKVCEDKAHSGHTQEDPRTEYRPPPRAKGALEMMQRPDSASRPMFRRCKSSNDRPGSAPRQPLHLAQQNVGSQADTGPLFAPRRPSRPPSASQRPSSSSRRLWRPTSSNGEIPAVPREEAEALDRRNAMRPSTNQRPQSAMAAPALGVIGRSFSTNERGRNGGRSHTPQLQGGGGGGIVLPPIKGVVPSSRDAAGDRQPGTGSATRLPHIHEKPDPNRRRLPF